MPLELGEDHAGSRNESMLSHLDDFDTFHHIIHVSLPLRLLTNAQPVLANHAASNHFAQRLDRGCLGFPEKPGSPLSFRSWRMMQTPLYGKCLVLGGGGLAGLGWFAGLFHGMAQQGTDLRDADRIIGTSAGSATAAQLRSAQPLEQFFARQTDPALIADEASPNMAAIAELLQAFPKLEAIADHSERMRAVGRMAAKAVTVAPAVRRAMIERRLSEHEWPAASLTITAVDAESGELAVFDASSGVSLVDAVSASCAVPGVWPLVSIAGRNYFDGGGYTVDNAHIAAGSQRVVIASPFGTVSPAPAGFHLNDAVAALEAAGTGVVLIEPDATARAAMGPNPLDPQARRPSAEAGFAQGERLADSIGNFWSGRQ